MPDCQCPRCGSSDVVPRTVNDRLWAADPRGQTFEVALQLPLWSCRACRLCWEREEALAAKETAYQTALVERSASRAAA